jgi:hypothetical protein
MFLVNQLLAITIATSAVLTNARLAILAVAFWIAILPCARLATAVGVWVFEQNQSFITVSPNVKLKVDYQNKNRF